MVTDDGIVISFDLAAVLGSGRLRDLVERDARANGYALPTKVVAFLGECESVQDVIAVMRSLDVLDVFASAPRVRVSEGVAASNSLSATITVSRMVAFSAERLAGAIGILSGTGLAAP